ncbi:type II restriction endonuclease [Tenacibaculum dicentrarchi]|uniref:type II restriction endonuclease n=1 Tax=Tenacibaculum dicentrarchi TaxID=669041 RepID=UPI0035110C1B
MSESFSKFLSELSTTNSTLDFFVDFEKITKNVDKIAIKLNQLNFLIGKEDLKKSIEQLFDENPKCFLVLNILIAVRDNRPILDENGDLKNIYSYFENADLVYEFIDKTGLKPVFKNKQIKNLVDYVFGIEVGLDTNARKNRGGKNMEKALAKIFTKNEIIFRSEVKNTEFEELKSLGTDVKRFDFVIKTKSKTYLIETNYYNGGGSKLNEVARAYTDIAPKINQYENFSFVWVTDGQGWLKAKNKLQEAYSHIPLLFNLKTLPEFIEKIKREL